jgi:hypothetical protein
MPIVISRFIAHFLSFNNRVQYPLSKKKTIISCFPTCFKAGNQIRGYIYNKNMWSRQRLIQWFATTSCDPRRESEKAFRRFRRFRRFKRFGSPPAFLDENNIDKISSAL